MTSPHSLPNLAPEATVDFLAGRTVAILGFGAQGAAHAENLRDSGVTVLIGQRPAGPGAARATRAGFHCLPLAEAAAAADLIIFGLPDDAIGGIFEAELRPVVRSGQTLGFLHGFAIVYHTLQAPPDVDVVLLAPKGQGRAVRNEFVAGRGVGALVAVHQDATGAARRMVLGWAAGIGAHRTAILETTFREETETDLFGEQAVLCGGASALVQAAYDVLVTAGYPPELAYLECCHELKLVVDLMYEHGIAGMRERISSTARFGDLTRGPRVVDDAARARLRVILDEIRSGAFAREFLQDSAGGGAQAHALAQAGRAHPSEVVGAQVRQMLWGKRRDFERQRSADVGSAK